MGGSFQTSREIFQHPIWNNIVDFRLFFLIYGQAVYSEKGYQVSDGLFLERGQWCRSLRNLQDDLAYIENQRKKRYSLSVLGRSIDRLILANRIYTRIDNLGTVFTVVNYQSYQGFANYQSDTLGQTLGQPWNNKNKDIKELIKPIRPKRVYDEQSLEYRAANFLLEQIRIFKPDLKQPNLQSWANDMRLLLEVDKRDAKEIANVIKWVTADPFWQSNILSASALRKQWDKVTAKMNQGTFKPSNKLQPNVAAPTITEAERGALEDAARKQAERNRQATRSHN